MEDIIQSIFINRFWIKRYYNPLKTTGKKKEKKEGKCLIKNAMSFLGLQTHSQQILHYLMGAFRAVLNKPF